MDIVSLALEQRTCVYPWSLDSDVSSMTWHGRRRALFSAYVKVVLV